MHLVGLLVGLINVGLGLYAGIFVLGSLSLFWWRLNPDRLFHDRTLNLLDRNVQQSFSLC
jgi:hypothetical protein